MIENSTIAQIKKLPIENPLLKMMDDYNVNSLTALSDEQAQSFLAFQMYLLNMKGKVTNRRRG